MTADITAIRTDAALVLGYPGTLLRNANTAADEFFFRRTQRHLRDLANEASPECLGTILGTTPPPLTRWCGIALADRASRQHEHVEPVVAGLSYSPGVSRSRELFLVYARPTNEQEGTMRLLPFPSSLRLHVQDAKEPDPRSSLDGLTRVLCGIRVPSGISVSIPGLLPATTYTVDDLRAVGVWSTLEAIGHFYQLLCSALTSQDTPASAWEHARMVYDQQNPHGRSLADDVPEAVRRVFLPQAHCSRRDASRAITRIWSHPLDAPIVATFVYPTVLKQLRADHDLRYAPAGPPEERDRYFRLHIPIDELEAQDRYLGWLPADIAYREERTAIRDDLYTTK
jgi:hypothetical protein